MTKFKEPGFRSRIEQGRLARFGVPEKGPEKPVTMRQRPIRFDAEMMWKQMREMEVMQPWWLIGAPPKAIRAVNRYSGPYDHPKPKARWSDLFKHDKDYRNRLTKRGFKVLGSGAFSTVYGKPGSNKVIKVCHAGDTDPWPLFAAWAHANPSPFVPLIYSFKRHKGFYVAVMERMEETVYGSDRSLGHSEATELFNNFVRNSTRETRVIRAVLDLYPGIDQFLVAMMREFDGKARWDLHTGNWMLRKDGQLVVTDPISEGGSSRAVASKVQRIKGSSVRIAA
ncbi:MAG: hypothetical protein K2Y56_13610 [Methylobacterium sp.]|uniref:hypothetical protein n=1 Tax=Methylobacterium sp. TaxID=409 RepID=UPI0025F6FD5C|nr:hypothetical protein [Methylobacterium sp.]MBX9932557.1 hypothetical protein [Methylobacterium sp.]